MTLYFVWEVSIYTDIDDRTDEDMFRVLMKSDLDNEHVFTCTIGTSRKMTRADSHITSPAELISLMHLLAFGNI